MIVVSSEKQSPYLTVIGANELRAVHGGAKRGRWKKPAACAALSKRRRDFKFRYYFLLTTSIFH